MISTDPETLAYPKHIAPRIGLGVHEINALKQNGCRFYGRKTCVKWVREFLDAVTLKTEVLPAILAERFGVNRYIVSDILRNKTWKDRT